MNPSPLRAGPLAGCVARCPIWGSTRLSRDWVTVSVTGGLLLVCGAAQLAATCVYLNTVVAVTLGWAVLAESLTARTAAAVALVPGSVLRVQRPAGPARRLALPEEASA